MLALDRAQRGSVQFLTFMSQYIVSQPWPAGKQEDYLRIRIGSVDRVSTNKGDLDQMHSLMTISVQVKLNYFNEILNTLN